MINIKPDVLNALRSDSVIVGLLGGQYVWQLVAGDPDQYPRITFFEYDNLDSDYADDEPTAGRFYFQVDIWDKRPRDDIAIEVDRVMKSLGFSRISSADLYEDDTGICHKAMRFKTVKTL